MKDTARLIITMDCKRNCPDCCNKTDPSVKSAAIINNLDVLKDYKVICITGGEPMLNPKRTLKIIKQINAINQHITIYLYTALYKSELYNIIKYIKGVHYTLHYPAMLKERTNIYHIQDCAQLNPDKSWRLYIDNRVSRVITLKPNLWHRVEIKPWMKECSLPDNEKLFILKE